MMVEKNVTVRLKIDDFCVLKPPA